MTRTQMDYFIRTYELGNIAKAAEEFIVSRSVVSRIISNLEDELGQPLFIRKQSGVEPTPAGVQAYQSIQTLRRNYDMLLSRINDIRPEKEKKIIRVGVTVSNVEYLYDLIYKPFKAAHLDTEFQITETTGIKNAELLRDDKLDVIFVPGRRMVEAFPEFECIKLFDSQVCAAVSNNNPLSRLPVLNLEDLKDVPFVCLNSTFPSESHLRESYQTYFGKELNMKLKTTSLPLIEKLVTENVAVGIVPSQYVSQWEGVSGKRIVLLTPMVNSMCWNRYLVPSDELASLLSFVCNLKFE